MVRYRASSAFAPLPFDKHGVVGSIEVVEDFEAAALLADFVDGTGVIYDDAGHTIWFANEVAGAAVSNLTIPVSESDHPGIIRLETGGTIPADGDSCALQYGGSAVGVQDNFLLDTNGVYIATVLRIADRANAIVEFGLIGQTPAVPNSSVADFVGFAWDPEDASNVSDEEFFCQVNGAGTDSEEVSKLVSYVTSDWVLLEVAADSTSASFRITTEDNTETITITATMPVVGLRPAYGLEAVGAAEELLDIDLFVLRYMRRQALVASWLGQ